MVYPPGIPIFIPGEIITEENISYIFKNIEIGLPVQGPEDSTLDMIRVIKEQKPFYKKKHAAPIGAACFYLFRGFITAMTVTTCSIKCCHFFIFKLINGFIAILTNNCTHVHSPFLYSKFESV